MSINGIRTIARLELKQRARGTRWYIAIALWGVLIAAITALTYLAQRQTQFPDGGTTYDVVLFFVLGLGMLVMPALTATSINGDREQGVLATMQATLLTAGDIVIGKLVAAWIIALTFVAVAVPFLLIGYVQGGVDFPGALRAIVVLAIVLAAVCAVGLMFSSIVARPVASAVLTYLTTAGLVFLTAIVFVMSFFLVTTTDDVRVRTIPQSFWDEDPTAEKSPTVKDCVEVTERRDVIHTERTWWMLAVNPFTVVADASPTRPTTGDRVTDDGFTPLRYISYGVRLAKAGPPPQPLNECYALGEPGENSQSMEEMSKTGAVWPYGLAFYLLLGAGSAAIAHRRLRTPIKNLPSGTRVA